METVIQETPPFLQKVFFFFHGVLFRRSEIANIIPSTDLDRTESNVFILPFVKMAANYANIDSRVSRLEVDFYYMFQLFKKSEIIKYVIKLEEIKISGETKKKKKNT